MSNKLSSGVVVLVDTMTEAHQELLSILDVLNELRNVGFITDGLQHSNDSFIGTTMLGTIKG